MKLLLLISLLTITIEATPRKVVLQEWKNFKDTYGKTYENENEDMARLKTFWNNRRSIRHHNKKFSKGKVGYDVSMNCFADLFETELASYRGHNNNRGFTRNADRYAELNSTDLPTSIDWRETGAVTPVKDQGKCGSCYAFSAIAALESHHYLATGETIILSEQNAIDCTWQYGNDGCDGGLEYNIFEYVRDNGGIDTQESYPYQGIDCVYCRHKPKYKKINCEGPVDVPEGEIMLQSALAYVGPVTVGINCLRSFHSYKSGVYYDPCCTIEYGWHGVLVVGYGTTTDGKDYWIIKNSWGPEWGENGFAKMARNLDNQCFIASWPCYPIVRS